MPVFSSLVLLLSRAADLYYSKFPVIHWEWDPFEGHDKDQSCTINTVLGHVWCNFSLVTPLTKGIYFDKLTYNIYIPKLGCLSRDSLITSVTHSDLKRSERQVDLFFYSYFRHEMVTKYKHPLGLSWGVTKLKWHTDQYSIKCTQLFLIMPPKWI